MKTAIKIIIGLLLAGGLFMFAFYRTPQERAFAKHLKLAQAGDMEAAIAVAEDYMSGTGTKPSTEKALSWYKQAAAADKPQAAWELYQFYVQKGVFEQREEDLMDFAPDEEEPEFDSFEDVFPSAQGSSSRSGRNSVKSRRNDRAGDSFAGPSSMRRSGRNRARNAARRAQANKVLEEEKGLALAYLQSAAQADFIPAQQEMGNLYAQGNVMPKHEGQSLFWYFKAAKNGSSSAQAKVNAIATENPALSAEMERFMQNLQGAQTEDPAAMLEVARAYRSGTPILQDQTVALEWYKKAWDKSDHKLSQAAFELSDMYYKGEGTEPDPEKAADFLAKAAELKNPQAQYLLGEAAYTDQPARMEDAFAWFSNAAAQGHVKAQYMTGFMLLQGQGTAKSVPLAIRFFEQAAEQNDPSAQYVLGQIYLKGLGVRRSPRQGRAWLERAVENGSEPAKEMLGI